MLCVANIDASRIVIDLRKPIQRFALHPRFSHRPSPPVLELTTSARVPSV
jgi:hypothetical protein